MSCVISLYDVFISMYHLRSTVHTIFYFGHSMGCGVFHSLIEKIADLQKEDEFIKKVCNGIQQGEISNFKIDEHGVLRLNGRICVPDVPELKRGK